MATYYRQLNSDVRDLEGDDIDTSVASENGYDGLDSTEQGFPLLSRVSDEPKKRRETIIFIVKLIVVLLAIVAAAVVYFLPSIMPDHVCARHALAVVIIIVTMWVTEVAPVWATSLLIPLLVVWGGVYASADDFSVAMDAPSAAKRAASKFFSSTVMLALGAFTMSAAFTKYQWSDRLAYFVLSRVGTRPVVVTIAVMFLGMFLSCFISNVAAPVVCLSLVRPLLKELPAEEPYVKVLLLAIAFSNNIGGMTTPIASPQNLIALQQLQKIKLDVGWGQWLATGLPIAVVCNAIVFGFLWLFFRPKLTKVGPLPETELRKLSIRHFLVLIICVATIVLWALNSQIASFVGDNGIVGLIPVIVFFATQTLSKADFKELPWDVLMLLAGGMVLGDAMSDQPDPSKPGHGILVLIADGLGGILKSANASTWVVAIVFCGLMWLIGNFVSHTVSAIMLIPVVAEVGCLLANGDCAAGHTKLLVMLTTMIDSGAMALPVSSFPNAQMYSETDKHGRQILAGSDFIKTGFLVGLLEVGVVISGGYFLMLAVGL